jgi:NADH:ubiquinone oxidoreductase subunit 3 (subunit A)
MTTLVAYLLLFLFVGCFFVFIHLFIGKQIRPSKPHSEKLTIYECGEPTIGSAWIQFDLRFYVVALLFVIFDVEVAFFFPWAVVFGKATALGSQPLPTTPEARERYLGLVHDLVPPYPENRRPRQDLADQILDWPAAAERRVALDNEKANLEGEKNKLEAPRQELEERRIKLTAKKDDPGAAKELDQVAAQLADANAQAGKLTQQIRRLDSQIRALDTGVLGQRGPAQSLAWIAFWDIVVFFGVLLVGFAYLWKRGDLEWVRSTAAEAAAASEAPVENAEERGDLVGVGR